MRGHEGLLWKLVGTPAFSIVDMNASAAYSALVLNHNVYILTASHKDASATRR